MSDVRTRTFRSVAEYKATYYPEPHHPAEARTKAPEDVGKEIASVSLEVIRESVVKDRDPVPRLAPTEHARAKQAYSGLVRRQG